MSLGRGFPVLDDLGVATGVGAHHLDSFAVLHDGPLDIEIYWDRSFVLPGVDDFLGESVEAAKKRAQRGLRRLREAGRAARILDEFGEDTT